MTKSKPQIKIVNAETGEEIVRDATAQEIAQMKIDAETGVSEKAEAEAKKEAERTKLYKPQVFIVKEPKASK